eukprot:TRINITY_DN20685_c0_g1_i6.p2 TRINITY_DN20685_c0_g1~~TRINITY_DN20685_c0_g1_i6.p2  ORF type:complete len:1175 (+),score=597.81 TRINITY_DN20685_c0_g1_i6:43-3567(+)
MASATVSKADAAKLAAQLEERLAKAGPFLGGQTPSAEDAKAFEQLLGNENAEVARWAKHIAAFPAAERKKWEAAAPVVGTKKADKKAAFAAGEGQGLKIAARKVEEETVAEGCLPNMPDYPNFPKREEEVAEMWKRVDAFRTSVKQSEGKKPFTFYDGPPFATGLPHYGHILAGTIKDTVCRWAHQTGHHVERRFGWDCHGLPIEFEIEKELGIKTSHDVMELGIKKYNEHCRGIVMRYAAEWEKTVTRMGRWIDFENDYKTMNLSYMESVWWVFRQLWDKDLVYRGYKVMPYSIGCTTVLSNFEANMNYKKVDDPSVVVTLPIVGDESVSLLAWTTTPWTLPSNLMLCVNPDMKYVQVEVKETQKRYILAEARLVQIFPKLGKQKGKDLPYTVVKEYTGKDLVGMEYVPLFDYFAHKKKDGAFKVVMDAYVTSDSGTGVVHQAPAFGEDDYRVCLEHKVISKDESVPCPVDMNGCFTEEVPEWKGVMVKDADPGIQKHLKDQGRLYSAGKIFHDYPFCWRSEKPLIYKAVASWFVNVTAIKERLLANNLTTHWVPQVIQTGRFNNWLEQARDWAVSRNRYWGTPLPIWVSEDYTQQVCAGSVEELERLTGTKVTDLHRDSIDDLQIPDPRGEGYPPLRRIPEVFDCWFESGSMPYAQQHYPFEKKEEFESKFPADFIAEGIDQTRGWFYTLMVLSTALFDKAPFKNLIVNGLVLAENGQKMSKRLRNYPPVDTVIDKYGADAIRMCLINSPVVRGLDLRFKEDDVKNVIRDVLLPLYNSLRFFTINHNSLVLAGESFDATVPLTNVMDRWITAEAEKLVSDVTKEMAAYHLYTVVPVVLKWVENLTNTYVRMNRKRMKGVEGLADQRESLATLFNVLLITSRVMGAFTPYMSEQIYQQLKPLAPEALRADSVHYLMVPEMPSGFDEVVIRKIERLQAVCVMVRTVRDRKGLGVQKPVKKVIVINADSQYAADMKELEEFVREEVNCFELECTTEEGDWVLTRAEAEPAKIGKKYGKNRKAVNDAIATDPEGVARSILQTGKASVGGFDLVEEDVKLVRSFRAGVTGYETHTDGRTLVLVNVERDADAEAEASARAFVSRVQKLRKRAGLAMTDKIKVFFETTDPVYSKTLATKLASIAQALGSTVAPIAVMTDFGGILVEQDLEGLRVVLTRA